MKASRLSKLASLTQGAALVGIGLAAACTKGPDPQPPVVTSPPPAPDTEGVAPVAQSDDGGVVRPRHFPIPNAMPPRFRHHDGGDDGGD